MSTAMSLAATYREARARFLDAAAAADARVDSYRHPMLGREDEELFVDVAEVGPTAATSAVVVVSGTHGVEGYLGSELQARHLLQLESSGEPLVRWVFVHALNPYGFSWVRRVNEDNVDLNRNFIDWTQPPPGDHGYAELADMLVPPSGGAVEPAVAANDLEAARERMGKGPLIAAIATGQYTHPTGLFYGGTGPTWSHDWLQGFLGDRLGGCERAAILDIHTALGRWGDGILISSDPPDSDAFRRQTDWWGEVTSVRDPDSIAGGVGGEWLSAAPRFAPDTEVTAVALEFGTVAIMTVMNSLRADAVLHATGDPRSTDGDRVRAQVRAAFLDDDSAWLELCRARYESVTSAAARRLDIDA